MLLVCNSTICKLLWNKWRRPSVKLQTICEMRCLLSKNRQVFFVSYGTLCRSGVWIGMKVLGADSIILGTRKVWWMFPIKQKLNITAAFFHTLHVIKMFKTRQFFWLSIVQFPCPPGLLIRQLFRQKNVQTWLNWIILII